MIRRGRLGAFAQALGLCVALVAGAASAQTPSADPSLADDPLALDLEELRKLEAAATEPGEELPLAGLIREAQGARATCNLLVDQINALLGQWRSVRAGELDRETFGVELTRAEDDWDGLRSRCRTAKDDLEREQQLSIPVNVLDWEREQLERLWRALVALCRAWVDERPRSDIDVAAKTFSGRLASYARWLDRHATFWDGSWLHEGRDQTCVGDTQRTAANLASLIREQMVVPPSQRDPAATQDLFTIRNALETTISRCTGDLSPLQEMELRVLGQKIAAYGRAIAALEAGDSAELQAAMDREQELTGRLLRCRTEHEGDSVSAACTARPPE